MAKAMLIMDMPSCCNKCELKVLPNPWSFMICGKTKKHIESGNQRPTWCPLREYEEWKDVVGYEGIYQVSNLGRVRNKDKILKPSKTGKYRHLALCKNGTKKDVNIHRLVAEAFIPNPHNYPCINHIDENKENNVASNLEWCDYRHNLLHSTSTEELSKRAKEFMSGETNPNRTQVLCVETGKVYESIKDASEELGIDASLIVKVCKGKPKRKTAGGYHWKYYNACIDEILGGGE